MTALLCAPLLLSYIVLSLVFPLSFRLSLVCFKDSPLYFPQDFFSTLSRRAELLSPSYLEVSLNKSVTLKKATQVMFILLQQVFIYILSYKPGGLKQSVW